MKEYSKCPFCGADKIYKNPRYLMSYITYEIKFACGTFMTLKISNNGTQSKITRSTKCR